MAGVQDLHKDITSVNELCHADQFIAEEVSYPAVNGGL